MVQFFQDLCFTRYELTYTIDENLGGKWTNLVKPLGFVAILLFLASLLLLFFFQSWATIESKKRIRTEAENSNSESEE